MARKALGRGLDALIPDRSGSADYAPAMPIPGAVTKIPLKDITPNPYQPRGRLDPEQMREMIQSVRERGLVQPILVRVLGDQYQIVAGERRYRAAKEVGLESIPAVIREFTDQEMLEIALVENVQREDLNPVDEAEAYQILSERFNLTQREIAAKVGKDRSSVANTMRLLQLPESVRRSVSRGTLSMGHARALLGLESPGEQVALGQEAETRRLSVREVEGRVQRLRRGSRATTRSKKPETVELEERMQRWLGTKVRISGASGRGRLTIEYYTQDDLGRIIDILRSGPRFP